MTGFFKTTLLCGICCVLSPAQLTADDLAKYPVRWTHGGQTDYGQLVITTASFIFNGDEGGSAVIPFIYVEEVRIVDQRWIQVRTTLESGLSLGRDDVYNFGVVGGAPDPAVIRKVNSLVVEARKLRVNYSEKLEGEFARYMVSKSEVFGDDSGILVICDDRVLYLSDTGGKEHNWSYRDLAAVELGKEGELILYTDERSIIKLGLGKRAYRFFSKTDPFKTKDVAYIFERIK